MEKRKLHPAWWVLVGVIIIRGFAGGGINMSSGLFLSPVSSDLGVGIGNLSLYFSITSIALVIFLPFAGKLINKYNIRLMAIIGAALQGLSFAAFGLMCSVYGWYLLAIPHAIGAAIIVNLLAPIMINRWFAKSEGSILGIQMAFVGLFGAFLQPLTSDIIARDGWRTAYYILGVATFVVVVAATLIFLRNSPNDAGLKAYGAGSPDATEVEEKAPDSVEIPETVAVRSASFYLLLLFMIAITGVGVFTQHIATYGTQLGFSLKEIGWALSLTAIGNSVGSILIGIISDRIGSLKTCYGMIGFGIVAVLGFLLSSGSIMVFYMSTFLHGMVSAGIMVLSPILTLKFYGQKDYERIYAKVAMGAPLASIILIPTYGFIYDATKSYFAVLVAMILLFVIALMSISAGWARRCTQEGCPRWKKS